MENEIKQLYSNLTGGKEITGDDYMISQRHFSSVTRDRFIAELKKRGINWNGSDIHFAELTENAAQSDKADSNGLPAVRHYTAPAQSNGFSVGVDIQNINELPSVPDFWEDTFYKSKFKPLEIGYCLNKERPLESFTGIYSCKEALLKCDEKLKWEDIEITYSASGKPEFPGYFISISHSGEFAIAIAVKNERKDTSENGLATGNISREEFTKSERNSRTAAILLFLLVLALLSYIIYRDFIS